MPQYPTFLDHQDAGRAGRTFGFRRAVRSRPAFAGDGTPFAEEIDTALVSARIAWPRKTPSPSLRSGSLTTSRRRKAIGYEALAYGRVIPTAPICTPSTCGGGRSSRPKPELSAPGASRGPWSL